MSGKEPHVPDSSVLERRLRFIYDLLDNENYSKAKRECDKLLAKSPNLDRVMVLKALSLLRLGRKCECVQILDSLATRMPSDDATMQTITMCYRDLKQLDKISKIYEAAIKVDPTNEELHTHLFMAYVRMSDFKQQQQSAMALYKVAPKNPYFCWAVMSIILQATRGEGVNDPKKRTLLLALAERMFDKMIGEGKLEAEQEVQLYVMVLEKQEKYEKILQVLDGPLGARLHGDPSLNKLPYLTRLVRWSEVNVLCKKFLSESMDRWDVWKQYVASVFELRNNTQCTNNHDNSNSPDVETPDDTPEKAHEFICKLLEAGSEGGFALRGPFLARFELYKRLERNEAAELLGNAAELFVEYFGKFGHKPCCVSDLRGYLSVLSDERRLELAGRLIKDVGISSTSVPQTEQQMQRHICALQLSRLCGAHGNLSAEHVQALVKAFSYHYEHGHIAYGARLLSTDQAPADSYTLLAVHLLHDLYVATRSSAPLLAALALLKKTLKNSPSNFHVKLLMLRIYHILGCWSGAHQAYKSLDVKHLQLDSMCHIHCARLTFTGHYGLAADLFDATLKFFITNYKDNFDHLTFSYKFGSFVKLTEFMDFRERLNSSLHYTMTAVDRQYLAIVKCVVEQQVFELDRSPRDDPIDWDKIRDNSDYGVYISWDPERIDGAVEGWPETRQISQEEVKCVRLRAALLSCVQSAIHLGKCEQPLPEDARQLESDLTAWKQLHEEIGNQFDFTEKWRTSSLSLPLPSRLRSQFDVPYRGVLEPVFDVLLAVTNGDAEKAQLNVAAAKEAYRMMVGKFCDGLEADSTNDVYLSRRRNLEHLSCMNEIFSIAFILCFLCLRIRKKLNFNGDKRVCSVLRSKLIDDIVSVTSKLSAAIGKVQRAESTSTDELAERLSALQLGQKDEASLLDESLSASLEEIRQSLFSKHRLVTSNQA